MANGKLRGHRKWPHISKLSTRQVVFNQVRSQAELKNKGKKWVLLAEWQEHPKCEWNCVGKPSVKLPQSWGGGGVLSGLFQVSVSRVFSRKREEKPLKL